MAGDAADERDDGLGGVYAEALDDTVALRVTRGDAVPVFRVDAVEHDVDLVFVDVRVGLEDRFLHAGGDTDDRVGVFHRVLLGPGGDVVTAAELLALPRAVRFQRVGSDHVGDTVQEASKVAAQAGVPGVRVDHVDVVGGMRHPETSGQRLDRAVGLGQFRVGASWT